LFPAYAQRAGKFAGLNMGPFSGKPAYAQRAGRYVQFPGLNLFRVNYIFAHSGKCLVSGKVSSGMGGRFEPECMAGLGRNGWQV